ncbi:MULTISPECIES: CgeB family protein [Acetobacter]|uniref:Glycosyltransferase n=1 Tax=Acetobacter thailandicus TaxID=1502842 RepID=A0ABT3QG69_9PROT|nr:MULTISPECIES: glycosyltransferase [Acetobacter]MBS0960602.1 glycosyltransferase [Acetobacter thailandicus]MBS0980091.1 glycosyltransferase [Acetobacter thailandicus]MBS0985937.1 glycosyltransferase [Acetobacter thailandicus]MBS1003021.1 glycosyltransferase [Acetobacter thailandicus]MCX2564279.1 glycosyltransferase [Acetobacter thailandicus]
MAASQEENATVAQVWNNQRVLVCSGGRYESQANAQIRESIMDGWVECFGEENVTAVHISGAAESIAFLKPTIVFAIGSYLPESTYFGEVCREAKKIGATTVFWATEDPYEQDANYRVADDFDVIFSCDRWGHNFYQRDRVFHLPLAASRKLHYAPVVSEEQRHIDVLFCGVAFTSRKDIVRNLLPSLRRLNIRIIGPGWNEFGIGFSDDRIDKKQLVELYQHSRIVLNLGRSLHFENKRFMISPSTPGPRTFEAAAAGAFQIFHEDTYELRRYYPASEIPSFSNKRDFDRLISEYLAAPEKRLQATKLAQKRTLEQHTYGNRIREVVKILEDLKLIVL